MKMIITESQINILKEYIKPEEAYDDNSAIQTILDGKRGVAFVALQKDHQLDRYKKLGLVVKKVIKNPYSTYVVYNPEYEKEAEELLNIADKNNGYLPSTKNAELIRRIGHLLSYEPESVEKFIKEKGL